MRNIVVILCAALFFLTSCNPKGKSTVETKDSLSDTNSLAPIDSVKKLDEVIYAFVKAYEERNDAAVNALIHPELGLTIIYRPGVSDTFVKVDSLSFLNPFPAYYAYPKISNSFPLSYASLPEYDCGTEKWSKVGLFCDTSSRPNQLSTIVDFETELKLKSHNITEVKEIKNKEQASYRVILTAGEPLIFHVQQYNGQWYITVLDRAYAGCDA